MPITLNPVGGGGTTLGWGMTIVPHTTFLGPLPAGSFWLISFFSDSDRTEEVFHLSRPWTANDPPIQLTVHNSPLIFGTGAVADGGTVYWDVQLWQGGTTVVDESNGSLTWQTTSGIYPAILQSIPAAGTGLTSTQADQLATAATASTDSLEALTIPITTPTGIQTPTLAQLLAMPTLDALTLEELTAGPTASFVSAELPNNAVGIIIRITSVPDGRVGLTPDSGYYRPELGVANFFRGSDLVVRAGIHTVSRFIYPLPGAWPWWSSFLFGGTLPPDYSIQVWFAEGVLGQVFLTKLP